MAARTLRFPGNRRRLAVIVFLLAVFVSPHAAPIEVAEAADAVAEVEGAGWSSRLACLGCAGTLIGLSGGTLGGVLVLTALAPEAVAGCAYICYTAY